MASRAKHTARACRWLRRFLPGVLLWARSASLRFAIVMWTSPFCSSCTTWSPRRPPAGVCPCPMSLPFLEHAVGDDGATMVDTQPSVAWVS